jgi:hypothetical protein
VSRPLLWSCHSELINAMITIGRITSQTYIDSSSACFLPGWRGFTCSRLEFLFPFLAGEPAPNETDEWTLIREDWLTAPPVRSATAGTRSVQLAHRAGPG